MKIGILQFSDIHIKSSNDVVLSRVKEIYSACKSNINETVKIIIVTTGDISWSGDSFEYNLAKLFFQELCQMIKSERYINSIDFVFVPGNHDCSFPSQDVVRECILRDQSRVDDIHEDLIDMCLSPQKNFWNFLSEISGEKYHPKISYRKSIQLSTSKSIHFHCYNTSLFSTRQESVGSLIVPKSSFLNSNNIAKEDIVISIYHHCTGWLSPNTNENNKKIFENHLFKSSNIVMCGHEHQAKLQITSSLASGEELIYLESNALQNEEESSFGFLLYDTEQNNISIFEYKFNGEEYIQADPKVVYVKSKINGIAINDDFKDTLNHIDIPIKHPKKDHLQLSDIFIYPDLEPLLSLDEEYEKYIDASELIKNPDNQSVILIEGSAQSGKTSLLRMLYLQLYNNGYYPLWIDGDELKSINTDDITKRDYKKQYNYRNFDFNQYMKLDNAKRILLIDNLNNSILNKDGITKIIDKFSTNFSTVIITNIESNDVKSLLLTFDKSSAFKRYRLLNFGYLKRNQLINKWLRLGADPYSINEALLEHEVKLTFDQITNLLGEQLIPSYPIFILTLLQGLNHNLQTFDITQTSYAYCYQTLIIVSLFRANVNNENINGIINFITELSYELYDTNKKYISKEDLTIFYNKYESKYQVPYSYDKIVSILCESYLLSEKEEEIYCFTYKYIYFYLVAKKISTIINTDKGSAIIKKLCKELHKEQNANILVFITHHNGDNNLLEELLFSSMLPFESYEPITLKTTDALFTFLSSFVEDISNDILISDMDHNENREKLLKKQDKLNGINKRYNDKKDDIENEESIDNKDIIDITQTFKIVKILGQIVKNQKGSFEKDKIISLLTEAYLVCFRTINFYRNKLVEGRKDIIDYFVSEIKKNNRYGIEEKDLENRINSLLMMMLYRVCLSTFSNLSLSVGTSRMDSIYDTVANNINSPAAKLISFTIKTYYGSLKIVELEELANELKNNPVATHILKARVINYVYNNQVEYSIKQKIGKICGLRLINQGNLKKR